MCSWKRLLSIMLTVTLLVGVLPVPTALAAGKQGNAPSSSWFVAVSGKIVDERGKGIENVSVHVLCQDDKTSEYFLTNRSGEWAWKELIAGYTYRISYYHRDYAFEEGANFTVLALVEPIVLPVVAARAWGEAYAVSPKSDFTYNTLSGDNVAISGYTGAASVVVVPEKIDGNTVQVIGSNAFSGNAQITGVRLPAGVVRIEDSAFRGCTGLAEVRLPNTLIEISRYAFEGCTGFAEVALPDSVEKIGVVAFGNCVSLRSIIYPRNWNEVVISNYENSWSVFAGCKMLEKITIPEGVTTIPSLAFYGASSLKEVVLPESLEDIGAFSFSGCRGLTNVSIPSKVTLLADRAFEGCTGLTELSLPNTLTEIDMYAFQGCTGLTEVNLPDSVEKIGVLAFGDCINLRSINYPRNWNEVITSNYENSRSIFAGCAKLETITIPEGITSIPAYAFYGASNLKEVVLPQSLKDIGGAAFSGCTALRTLTLHRSVTTIGYREFEGCTGLTELNLPNTLTEIDMYAFQGCTGLTEVTLPDSVEKIGVLAFGDCINLRSINYPRNWNEVITSNYENSRSIFAGCTKLETITIPEGITSIPAYAFYGASSLKEVVLPQSIKDIGGAAFRGCTGLRTLTLPRSVTTIGYREFEGCTGLTELNLPNTLTQIDMYAFQGCTGLTEVNLPDSVEKIGVLAFGDCINLRSINYPRNWNEVITSNYENSRSIFAGCTKLETITIPEGIILIPAYAFYGASGLKEVSLPESLTDIGSSAFSGCTALRTLTLPRSVTTIGSRAFSDCATLRYAYIPGTVTTIGEDAFRDDDRLLLYCEDYSYGAVYAVFYGLPFVLTDGEPMSGGVTDRNETYLYADTSGIAANGCITMSVDYSVPADVWPELSQQQIVVRIPAHAEVLESSIKRGGVICIDYTIQDGSLSVPVSDPQGVVKFSAKIVGQGNLTSYARLVYQRGGDTRRETIGILNERLDAFTLNMEPFALSGQLPVQGTAPASSEVRIFVDDIPTLTLTANRAGIYRGVVTAPGLMDNGLCVVTALSKNDAGEPMVAYREVRYQPDMPIMNGFRFFAEGGQAGRAIDLYEASQNGIAPSISFASPTSPYRFEVGMTNPQSIETLYVTSTRNNIRRVIEAKYDEATDQFVAEGYFDEDNKLYVPGTLSVEYSATHDAFDPQEPIDWKALWNNLGEPVRNSRITADVTNAGATVSGLIDLSGTMASLGEMLVEYSITSFDLSNEASLELGPYWDLFGAEMNILKSIASGESDQRYLLHYDSTMEHVFMAVKDEASLGAKWYAIQLSMATPSNPNNYTLQDLADGLATTSTVAGLLSKQFGLVAQHRELYDEILISPYIADKDAHLKLADAYYQDQTMFNLLTTFLPLIVGAPMVGLTVGMAAPAALFTAMLSIMVFANEAVFKPMRLAQIKGQSFGIHWRIDPSGHVFDALSGQALKDVAVTAHCIAYDGSDAFWDQPPGESEYGEKWDASEYNQENSLRTDPLGQYAWDVPEGWWRVHCEKEGYKDAWSEWLPVPPIQTEVNIGMMPQ